MSLLNDLANAVGLRDGALDDSYHDSGLSGIVGNIGNAAKDILPVAAVLGIAKIGLDMMLDGTKKKR